jgi:hypothetical protein
MAARGYKPSWNTAADVLGAVLSRLPSGKRLHEYRVWEVWESTVGTAVARRAQPQRIQDGKLFVTVSHSAWMQELQFAKIVIKEKLNQQLGAGVIKDIFFMLGKAQQVVELPTPPPRRRIPLSAGDLTVPQLGHPEIEAALASLLAARQRRLSKDEDED